MSSLNIEIITDIKMGTYSDQTNSSHQILHQNLTGMLEIKQKGSQSTRKNLDC